MNDYLSIANHDTFRYGGRLNKSAAEIYWRLLQEPMSASQLEAVTGRSRSTIFRALRSMASLVDTRTGEYLPMVQSDRGIWHVETGVNLDKVALVIGTAGIGKRKRQQYRKEQEKHRKDLFSGRKG